jgi:hypothetical protein
MHPKLSMFLADRASARAAGDAGLERAIQADLDRLGYREPEVTFQPESAEVHSSTPVRVETATGMETTAVRASERAVPKPFAKGGRQPKRRAR